MKRIIIGLVLISIILLAGCRGQYYLGGGIVSHENSLEVALAKCRYTCYEQYSHKGTPTPKLEECTTKECQCLC